ncbi:MAG: cob(I)yrinic acid a,c-diamide adenosyltransferase [Syntrophomonadaceae bacterium]|nr:cob(I)yrinic acid a,c-diamide adenosyltransferase [Syntrophomonadaceae bacterium]
MNSLLQIYYGDGKGKTTAALGLAMRAAGHGFKVRIIQFMKGNGYSGELASAFKLGIEMFQFGRPCPHAELIKNGSMQCDDCGQCWISSENITELDRKNIAMAWQLTQESVQGGQIEILILDEILHVLDMELIAKDILMSWLQKLPSNTEIILTGSKVSPELLARADLVSEVRKIKHPFEQDIKARRGIEY